MLDNGQLAEARTFLLDQLSGRSWKALDKALIYTNLVDLAVERQNIKEAVDHIVEARSLIDKIPPRWSLGILFAEAQLRYIGGDIEGATVVFNTFVRNQKAMDRKFLPMHREFQQVVKGANEVDAGQEIPVFSFEDYSFKAKSPQYNMEISRIPRPELAIPGGASTISCDITLTVLANGHVEKESIDVKESPTNERLRKSCERAASRYRYKPYIKDGEAIRVEGVELVISAVRRR